ncbi:MAG: hypothetical protein ACQEW8_00105 [Actinomycetota bacterium]
MSLAGASFDAASWACASFDGARLEAAPFDGASFTGASAVVASFVGASAAGAGADASEAASSVFLARLRRGAFALGSAAGASADGVSEAVLSAAGFSAFAAADAVVARRGARLRAGAFSAVASAAWGLVAGASVTGAAWSFWVSEKFSTSTPLYVVGNEHVSLATGAARGRTVQRSAFDIQERENPGGYMRDFAEMRWGQIHEITWSPPLDP